MELLTKPNKSINPETSDAQSEPPSGAAEPSASEPSVRKGEGVGVFRGLLLMLLFYLAAGWTLWFAWQAWRNWHVR